MLPTQELIDRLAGRIERAYLLRRPSWRPGCSTPRVWNAAALSLWHAHITDSDQIPLDPELYVASQDTSGQLSDPWTDLAGASAERRYHSRVCRIIAGLRTGLKKEVRVAERAIQKGREIGSVLKIKPGGLSPLGCYIVARRAGRVDLAERFTGVAIEQHRSCPLYRLACLGLISLDLYPVESCRFTPLSEFADLAMLFAYSPN